VENSGGRCSFEEVDCTERPLAADIPELSPIQVLTKCKFQGESVYHLRNFNIVGFLLFIVLRYMFRS
jgi:hypothetical protein